ncbi:hypothetical protein [Frankia sp. AgB32]|uniref:hypothetical protein n=1 Tax=Frankia sp. AgB32 TaxID=631119 RepID=UPI00200F6DEB|nr:hypothetical protein [Frankia sp. AgB32]
MTELELQLAELQRDRWSVAPAVLFPPAFAGWQQVETMLNRRVLLPTARRLTLMAGHFAVELSTVARFGGDDRLGRRFADIAEEHAIAARDARLTGDVAGLQAWIAMDAGQWSVAADHAALGRASADRSQHARLAGYEAAAAAEAGDHQRAAEATIVMRATKAAGRLNPKPWGDSDEALYIALTSAATPGAGGIAIRHGEQAATAFATARAHQGVGLARLSMARGHLGGDHPEPDAAAATAIEALDAVAASPNAPVHLRASRLYQEQLAPWSREPLVQELGRRLTAV